MESAGSVWAEWRWSLGVGEEGEHFNLTAALPCGLADDVSAFYKLWSHPGASFPAFPLLIFMRLTGLFCRKFREL